MRRSGFTIIELIVVIIIITILAALGIGSYSSVTRNARNAQRKSDLADLKKALEVYKAENGIYPSTMVGGVRQWRNSCVNPTDYIIDVPTGQTLIGNTIDRLPIDPRNGLINPTSSFTAVGGCTTTATINCYYYSSNGTDFKILAHCAPEGTLTTTDPFYDPRRDNANGRYAWQVSSSSTSRGTTAGTGW